MVLKKKKKGWLGEALIESLKEVLAHTRGEIALPCTGIEYPNPPTAYKPKDIIRIRKEKNCTQKMFALYLNVGVQTIRAWELGKRVPSSAALRLLECVEKDVSPIGMWKRSSEMAYIDGSVLNETSEKLPSRRSHGEVAIACAQARTSQRKKI